MWNERFSVPAPAEQTAPNSDPAEQTAPNSDPAEQRVPISGVAIHQNLNEMKCTYLLAAKQTVSLYLTLLSTSSYLLYANSLGITNRFTV